MEVNRGHGRTFDVSQLDALSKGGKAHTSPDGFVVLEPGGAPDKFPNFKGKLEPMNSGALKKAIYATALERARPDQQEAVKKELDSLASQAAQTYQSVKATGRISIDLTTFVIARLASKLMEGAKMAQTMSLTQRGARALSPEAARASSSLAKPSNAVADAVNNQMRDAELIGRYDSYVDGLVRDTQSLLSRTAGQRDAKASPDEIQVAARTVVAQFNDWATTLPEIRGPWSGATLPSS